MEISFDPAKSQRNLETRGLSFDQAADFDFESALYRVDDRREYGETRIRAMGYLGDRVHVLVFSEIEGGIRVISFRRANRREVKEYEARYKPRND